MKERAKIIWVLKEGCDPDVRLTVNGSFTELIAGIGNICDCVLEAYAEKHSLSTQEVKKKFIDLLKDELAAAE